MLTLSCRSLFKSTSGSCSLWPFSPGPTGPVHLTRLLLLHHLLWGSGTAVLFPTPGCVCLALPRHAGFPHLPAGGHGRPLYICHRPGGCPFSDPLGWVRPPMALILVVNKCPTGREISASSLEGKRRVSLAAGPWHSAWLMEYGICVGASGILGGGAGRHKRYRTPGGHSFIATTSNAWQSHRTAKDVGGGLSPSPCFEAGVQSCG